MNLNQPNEILVKKLHTDPVSCGNKVVTFCFAGNPFHLFEEVPEMMPGIWVSKWHD